jgi:putative aldouronate transport system substrate-binding protein
VEADGASMIPDSGYDVSTYGWEFGNQFNQLIMKGQSPTVWEETVAMNAASDGSPLVGFNLDPAPVATEIANCASVTEEYLVLLTTGSVDPATEYPIFLEKLEAAGAQKIIDEEQRQINAWLSSK